MGFAPFVLEHVLFRLFHGISEELVHVTQRQMFSGYNFYTHKFAFQDISGVYNKPV